MRLSRCNNIDNVAIIFDAIDISHRHEKTLKKGFRIHETKMCFVNWDL